MIFSLKSKRDDEAIAERLKSLQKPINVRITMRKYDIIYYFRLMLIIA